MSSIYRLPPGLSSSRQSIVLDTQEVRDVERMDYWREMVLRLFADVQIAAPPVANFHGWIFFCGFNYGDGVQRIS